MKDHYKTFETQLIQFFKSIINLVINDTDRIMFFLKVLHKQQKAAAVRKKWRLRGVEVPPVMIMSITKKCNLSCKGCYSFAQHHGPSFDLPAEKYATLFAEAHELGIFIIMLAGGEPLIRKDIIETAATHKEIMFPFFTNGLLLTEEYARLLGNHHNLIPLISVDGDQQLTDVRRGEGVYEILTDKMRMLKDHKVFFGTSITVTGENIGTITSIDFIKDLAQKGCKLFIFVEYVPADDKSDHLVLNREQKALLIQRIHHLRSTGSGLFIGFPGDEDQYGGCLAAGRGFIHINPQGKVEPCPFAPYSDTDVTTGTIRDGLQSELLKRIRENHSLLTESFGGCALWSNKNWLETLTGKN
jgi:MoaA/NifB/PqqE/SkfB family radical SAM enzyme